LGQQYIYSKIRTKESPSITVKGNNDYWYSYLSYKFNNIDQKYFSTKGWSIKVEGGYAYNQHPKFEYTYKDSTVNSDSLAYNFDNYFNVQINVSHFSKLNTKFSFSQNFTLAYILEENPYIANRYAVGGVNDVIRNQVTFVGLSESEVKTGSIASAGLGLQYKLAKKIFLTGRFNAALYDFHGVEINNISAKNNLLTGYGLTFGYDSLIGPIEFTLMNCDQDSKVRTNINIGFGF
jgi:NTE family protein